jgi:hypothetical protein
MMTLTRDSVKSSCAHHQDCKKIRWNKDFRDGGKRLCARSGKEFCALCTCEFAMTLIGMSARAQANNFAQTTARKPDEQPKSIKIERIRAK